mmetsp:Transcript_7666/g.21477  ORF Transcript_7666/g.21477 Transcript_7666/m.21477 type:complete len:431 (-) Transcript_7666:49-1341(-)
MRRRPGHEALRRVRRPRARRQRQRLPRHHHGPKPEVQQRGRQYVGLAHRQRADVHGRVPPQREAVAARRVRRPEPRRRRLPRGRHGGRVALARAQEGALRRPAVADVWEDLVRVPERERRHGRVHPHHLQRPLRAHVPRPPPPADQPPHRRAGAAAQLHHRALQVQGELLHPGRHEPEQHRLHRVRPAADAEGRRRAAPRVPAREDRLLARRRGRAGGGHAPGPEGRLLRRGHLVEMEGPAADAHQERRSVHVHHDAGREPVGVLPDLARRAAGPGAAPGPAERAALQPGPRPRRPPAVRGRALGAELAGRRPVRRREARRPVLRLPEDFWDVAAGRLAAGARARRRAHPVAPASARRQEGRVLRLRELGPLGPRGDEGRRVGPPGLLRAGGAAPGGRRRVPDCQGRGLEPGDLPGQPPRRRRLAGPRAR